MGVSFSKRKQSVTLVRQSYKASNDELNMESANSTPVRPEKVLPFDPRSPAEEFARTPITVAHATAADATPQLRRVVLDDDPRSPSGEVSRTPIVVSEAPSKGGHLPPLSPPPEGGQGGEDPRSPTVTVPRTPLTEQAFDMTKTKSQSVTSRLVFNDSALEESVVAEDKEEGEESEEEARPEVKSDATDSSGVLQNVTNTAASKQGKAAGNKGTPLGLLQAKQCRTLEQEFTKTQQSILQQLDSDENTIPSSTQFVQQI